MNIDEINIMSVPFPAGRFENALNAIDGNKQLFNLLGRYSTNSLLKIVNATDREKILRIQEKCKEADSEVFFSECITIGDDEDLYVVRMNKCTGQDIYRVLLIDVGEVSTERIEISSRIGLARDYMSLAGMIMFSYDKEANIYKQFWINNEQTVIMYEDNLDKWEKDIISEGHIQDEDIDAFHIVCDTLRKGEPVSNYTLKGSFITYGQIVDSYGVKSCRASSVDKIIGIWYVVNDITGEEVEGYIEGVNIDSLTGLLNKKAITEYAVKMINTCKDKNIALAIMDIDNFKNINDSYGHMFGDQVIHATAEIIKKAMRNTGVAGRIGGDEYMMVFDNYNDAVELRNILRCIKSNMHSLYQGKIDDNRLSCSVGVSRSGFDADEYNDLFKIADKSLYIAKKKGKDRYIIYDPALHGQFVISDKGGDLLGIRDSFYSQKDISQINDLLAELIIKGTGVMENLLSKIAATLMMDRVVVYWGKELEIKYVNPTEKNKYLSNEIFNNQEYMSMFEGDLLFMSHTTKIEFVNKEAYDYLNNASVYSIMQYRLRDEKDNVIGIISLENCSQFIAFPTVAVHIFENAVKIISAVLQKEN